MRGSTAASYPPGGARQLTFRRARVHSRTDAAGAGARDRGGGAPSIAVVRRRSWPAKQRGNRFGQETVSDWNNLG
jgi:hypothetical protein